jgi:hypothetical protein
MEPAQSAFERYLERVQVLPSQKLLWCGSRDEIPLSHASPAPGPRSTIGLTPCGGPGGKSGVYRSGFYYRCGKIKEAEFITEAKDKYGYICDPDGYTMEVGQSKPGFAYGRTPRLMRAPRSL